MPYQYTFAATLALASVYIFGNRLRLISHHRTWVSVAAGVSVSTVFIDLLPEIAENQATFAMGPHRGTAIFPEQAIYIATLLGFVLFYGLEYLVTRVPSGEGTPNRVFTSFRITAFAGYSGLIAFLLVHNIWNSAPSMLLYALAMTLHLHLVDHSLALADDEFYERWGRWILVAAVFGGWSVGILTLIPEQWLARIIGFICGGVIMNMLVVELPEGHGGRFWPFLSAAVAYSILLILILG